MENAQRAELVWSGLVIEVLLLLLLMRSSLKEIISGVWMALNEREVREEGEHQNPSSCQPDPLEKRTLLTFYTG